VVFFYVIGEVGLIRAYILAHSTTKAMATIFCLDPHRHGLDHIKQI